MKSKNKKPNGIFMIIQGYIEGYYYEQDRVAKIDYYKE